jgi:hypothetical protein
MKLNVFPRTLNERLQMEVFDDFSSYTDANFWTKSVGAGASAGITAATAGGVLALVTGGTQNIQALVASTVACFKLVAGRPFYLESLINYVEASTNNAGIAFGLSSVVTSVMLQDTTGVPATSFSGALIYKQAGDTLWRCISSNAGVQTLNTSLSQSQPSTLTDYQRLAIEGRDVDGSNFEVTFFAGPGALLDSTSHRPIKQTIAIAGSSAMKLVLFAKNPGGASAETLSVDYAYGVQRRVAG